MRNRRTLLTFVYELVLLGISAVVYARAFPGMYDDSGNAALALLALVPVFYVIDRAPWSLVWLYGLAFGAGFYSIYNYWLSTFHQLAIYICAVGKGIEVAIIFTALKAVYRCSGRWGYLFQALAYGAATYLCQVGFLAYPYGQAGSALYSVLPAIQITDITGIWGLNFLVVLPQTFVAGRIAECEDPQGTSPGRRWIDLICILGIWLLSLGYGAIDIAVWKSREPQTVIRVAAIQHNSDTWKGGYDQYLHNFELLKKLTEEAMQEEPDMVIWSETAFVPSVAWHTAYPSHKATAKMVDEFVRFGLELGVPLVTGNPEGVIADPQQGPYDQNGDWNRIDYNSVILFADGQILGTYRKQHLVPFTEYFPYQELMPAFTQFLRSHDFQWWLEGHESKVFEYDGYTFSTSICFEDTFGYISRNFVRAGSDLLLNLSNDSWSGAVSAQMQHMLLGLFRSVENKKTTVRSTNSGMSCMITPWGERVGTIEPFTEGWAVYEVAVYQGKTLYTLLGDWFAWMCLASVAGVLLLAAVRAVRTCPVPRGTPDDRNDRSTPSA